MKLEFVEIVSRGRLFQLLHGELSFKSQPQTRHSLYQPEDGKYHQVLK